MSALINLQYNKPQVPIIETYRSTKSTHTLEDILSNNHNDLKSLYSSKRTKMHNHATIGWLQKRYNEKTSKTYLLMPEQVNEHENIKKIFQTFDKDGSNSLDLDELTEMFQMYNIDIQEKDLQELFKVVDEDKDNALNFKEFRNCTLSEEANRVFEKIMRRVRAKELEKPEKERQVYLPTSFSDMIGYLSYCMKRKDLLTGAKDRANGVASRYHSYIDLLNMKEMYKSESLRDVAIRTKQKIKVKRNNMSARKLTTTLGTDLNKTGDVLKTADMTNTTFEALKTLHEQKDYDEEGVEAQTRNASRNKTSKLAEELVRMKKNIEEETRKEVKKGLNKLLLNKKEMLKQKENSGTDALIELQESKDDSIIETKYRKKAVNLRKSSLGLESSRVPRSLKYIDSLMKENMKIIKNSDEAEKFRFFLGSSQKNSDDSARQIKFRKIKKLNEQDPNQPRHSPKSIVKISTEGKARITDYESMLPKI